MRPEDPEEVTAPDSFPAYLPQPGRKRQGGWEDGQTMLAAMQI